MALLIGVLAFVFAPAQTPAGHERIGSRTLAAAMLSPTAGDDGAIRAPARDDDSSFTTALAVLFIVAVAAAIRLWRRAQAPVTVEATSSFDRARPRRGPPLLSV